MALKLTITSAQRDPLGARASIVFGVGGGSIGRALDNDWVLPDPRRYLSAHHARVMFRSGTYYLHDTSSNGVYVNGAAAPLGRGMAHALRHGDRLRAGEYQFSVYIDAEPAEAAEASAIFAVAGEPGPVNSPLTSGDIGVELSVRELLGARPDVPASSTSLTGSGSSSRIVPVDAFGQPALTEDTGLLAFDSGSRRAASGSARLQAFSGLQRELRIALEPAPAALEAFCRGAGVDSRQLPADAQARVLHLAGLLLREALAGVKSLALTQGEIRSQHGLQDEAADPQHIALQALPVEELLTRLLVGHGQHELDALQWLRKTLDAARRHDLAVVRALQAALGEYIARLEPAALTKSAPRSSPAHPAAANGPGPESGWTERFRAITEMSAGQLPRLFAEAFARAFASEWSRGGGSGGSASRNDGSHHPQRQ